MSLYQTPAVSFEKEFDQWVEMVVECSASECDNEERQAVAEGLTRVLPLLLSHPSISCEWQNRGHECTEKII